MTPIGNLSIDRESEYEVQSNISMPFNRINSRSFVSRDETILGNGPTNR
jgi:hypothetical protein